MNSTQMVLTLTCCGIANIALAQQGTLDSLINKTATQKSDSLKIEQLHADFFRYVYAKPAVAKQISEYTILKTDAKKKPYLHAQALIRKGIYYDVISKGDSAIYFYDEAFKIAAPRNDYFSMGNVYNDKGLVYWNNNDLELAMQQFVKGAEVFQKIDNKKGLSSIYNNIGLILYDLKRYDDARESHSKALRLRERLKDTIGLGASYTNLSNVYDKLGKKDSTRFYMRKAIAIKKESNDKRGLAVAYENLGINFREEKALDSAIFYTKKAQRLFNEVGSTVLEAKCNTVLAELYQLTGDFDKGIEAIERALVLQNKNNKKRMAQLEIIYGRLLAYKKDYKGSAAAYARAIKLNEAYQEATRTAQAQEYYEQYQTAEKEAKIAKQRAQIAANELKIAQRNKIILGVVAAVVLLGFVSFFAYRHQKLKAAQQEKELALKLALADLELQKRLQDQRLRISRDLHDNIGSQLTFMVSSIDNLKFAQHGNEGIAADKLASLSAFIKNTMSELRDTIWAMNKGTLSLNDIAERTATVIAHFNEAVPSTTTLAGHFKHETNPVFSAVNGMHIFRIIQEAVHNAVKYSEATKITVSIATESPDKTHIAINDNGKGFDLKNHSTGNGLKNMQQRASDLQAVLVIDTAVNHGTSIKLLLTHD